jgi:hypothetical protein
MICREWTMAASASTPSNPQAARSNPRLRRALSFWEVTAGGVGITIGAGIYVLVGEATAQAGVIAAMVIRRNVD